MSCEANRNGPLDLTALREISTCDPRRSWRGLDELAGAAEYQDFARDEFPYGLTRSAYAVNRRDALRLMAASAALAGLTACTRMPTEKIVPYAQQPPEEFVPGKPLFYATAMPLGGVALGVLVESHMGRPTKVEGNPDHPGSLGATDIFAQASVLTLYDPDRSQVVTRNGRIGSWSAFLVTVAQLREDLARKGGAGLRILTETVTSPTLADQLRALLGQFPSAKWYQYEPLGRDSVREGARLAFGKYVNTVYRFDQADVILALDADFLCSGPGGVRYAWEFAGKRRIADARSNMNRLYVVESTPSITGAMADHRLPLRATDIGSFARAVAEGLGIQTAAGNVAAPAKGSAGWIPALVRDLQAHSGASVVLGGDQQSPIVHALAHAMNHALSNVGKTVIYTHPIEASPVHQIESLRELVADIQKGQVEALLILGGNPVLTAPADIEFAKHLLSVNLRIHLNPYDNETSELCHWHVPEAHYLESWGDARAYDGTVSIIQPLIAPLYGGKSAYELLAVLLGEPEREGHDIVRDYWRSQRSGAGFEAFWETSLHDGLIAGTVLPPETVELSPRFSGPGREPAGNSQSRSPAAAQAGDEGTGLEIVFRPDPTIWDGRFANNAWLQELPKPLTKLTWDNVAMVSPATAERLALNRGDVVKLQYKGREVSAPIWVTPGHADASVTVHFGYGCRRAGRVGNDIGFNAYSLRTSDAPGFGSGLALKKTGERHVLATTQNHHVMSSKNAQEEESVNAFQRDLVRVATLSEFRKNPVFARDPEAQTSKAHSLYPAYKHEGHAWGMSIDLNSCVGCNACVTACRAENNVPVVGKDEVHAGREMDWIRIDTYYRGTIENPEIYNEAVLCMHCENAPCEVVCPVGATVHSPEGVNEMVYNRCVGTRYCSNNCPYKVRRFNFKLYSDWTTPSLFGLRNPNVTVRSRGVMEKCTYCIQRINAAKFSAEKQGRSVRDGEILTACQQACPTQAIVFGDVNNPSSRVAKLKAQSRSYGLLTELNTRPRTTYLARFRNPNPEIKE